MSEEIVALQRVRTRVVPNPREKIIGSPPPAGYRNLATTRDAIQELEKARDAFEEELRELRAKGEAERGILTREMERLKVMRPASSG